MIRLLCTATNRSRAAGAVLAASHRWPACSASIRTKSSGLAAAQAGGVSRPWLSRSRSAIWTPATGRPRSPAARNSAMRC
ncbi:MAG: hypothetical protein MZV49_02675 [Rhodopseudomonas palustris]|nr:hypothetical protein [Rhodopseudomonas palustris]